MEGCSPLGGIERLGSCDPQCAAVPEREGGGLEAYRDDESDPSLRSG